MAKQSNVPEAVLSENHIAREGNGQLLPPAVEVIQWNGWILWVVLS
jgi:hypothetical protein